MNKLTSVYLLCVLALVSCSKAPLAAGGSEADAPATPVEVATVTSETMHAVVKAEGVLFPIRQANVVGKISAPVQRFAVQRGDHVKQGQLLAMLEDRDLVAAAQESRQLYEQAQASYQNTTASTMPDDLTKAKTDDQTAAETQEAAKRLYDNRVMLFRQGAIAQKLVDDAKVALVQAQSTAQTARQHLQSLESVGHPAQLKAADAQKQAAEAHYDSAAAQVSYAEVRSPISGIVSDRPLNVGELASAGSALATIVDISRVVARVNVPVQSAAAIRVGKAAEIEGPGTTLQGKVTVVSPAVDPNSTTIQIWVEALNKNEALKPGTTVGVSIEASDIPNAVAVPVAALLSSEGGGERVLVVKGDSRVESRDLKVGVRTAEAVQALSGVKPGEQVVTSGGLGLDDKAKVDVSKAGGEKKDAGDEGKQ